MNVSTHSRPLVFTSEAGSGHDCTLFRSAAMIQHAVTVRWVSHLKAHMFLKDALAIYLMFTKRPSCAYVQEIWILIVIKSFVINALMECHN